MTQVRTSFLPTAHGFKFANRFVYSFEYALPLVGEIDLGSIILGLCGGMCFTTLDYFHAGKPIPGALQTPDEGTDLRKYLERRQFESLIPPAGIIKVLHWMTRSDRDLGRLTAGREFRMLRTRIDRGDPAVLALIREDLHGNPTENHQVVAVGYELNDLDRTLTIELYDPNHPGKTPSLTADFSNPSGGIDASQSTGEPLRGFFVIDYRKQTPL